MLGQEPKTVKDYFNEFGKRGRITQRLLTTNIESIRTTMTTEIGKDILFEDIQRFETLLWQLIDKGFGPEEGQVDDDLLCEMKYLKDRITRLSKRIYQYLEAAGKMEN
jgi:hypothetical protein